MADRVSPKPKARPRGRLFEKGQSGNPAGRPPGSRNEATLTAAALLEGEAEPLPARRSSLRSRVMGAASARRL